MRTGVAIIAVAGLVLLSAACGGGSPASQAGTARNGFSQCMRSNGVPNFPDPDTSGAIPKESLHQLGVSSSQFQSAQSSCRRLLPNGGSGPTAAQVQQMRVLSLNFSRCVRRHGVPTFPDPDSSGRIPDPATVGIDQGSPTFEAANRACARYRPAYMPANAAYESWARTHRH